MQAWKTFAAMPMWKRFVYAAPIAFLCFWAALSLQAKLWTEAAMLVVEMETGGEIESKNSFFNLKGEVGIEDVSMTMFDPTGENSITFKADRVVVETPGFGWYFWSTIFVSSEELPDLVGVRIENPRNVATDPNTPGNYTNLPYDAMGCVAEMLTPTDLRAMGVPTQRQIRIALEKVSDAETTARFRLRTEGAGEMEMKLALELKRPVKMEDFAQDVEEAPLKSVQLDFNDLGFTAKRNAYCAKKHNLTAAAFADYHMQEVGRFLGAQGVSLGQGTAAQYRDFATNGGTLQLRTAGTRKITANEFVELSRMQKMQLFPLMIAANGKAPANFAWNYGVQPAPAAAAADGAVAIPVANVVPAPVAAVPAGGLPEAGAVVAYAQLQSLTGHHVDITTTYGSVRKGVVKLVGPYEASVQLDKEEGGLLLHMPADRITEIRYTPVAPPATQAAKAN
ncbi:hypothetical protein LK996_09490 [Lysobacter sp. A6]|uniref:Uncharacterized protein n=1 Tax=Noviluteimonas lactosilytica TaxID=2888523 RepID=A0ABS8JI75_9GAMM|nr:hypothetical protein [Lysobacter lactosilyticus]MCC8363305.1 hypothetical protein [Lysobacter lactosilyticus]